MIGDITESEVDVIVNAADTDFTPGGGVARWIEKKGGKEIFKEAVKFATGRVGDVYITTAGNLKAKKVFHIPTIDWPSNTRIKLAQMHETATKAMEQLKDLGLRSIAFPLLGAGTVGLDEAKVTGEIADAIVHMEKDFPGIEGCICVFNKQIYDSIKVALPKEHNVIDLEK